MPRHIPYEENHRQTNNKIEKKCNICEKWFELNGENFYRNNKSPDGYFPYCIPCNRTKSLNYKKENYETILKSTNQERYLRKKDHMISYAKQYAKDNKERKQKNQSNWQRKNPDKVNGYNKKYQMHKFHEITEEQWQECLQFFDYKCAYCGITQKDAKIKYKQKLHKEHAINDGSNKIDNCTPACKSCNSSKHNKDWDEWYVLNNPKYKEKNYIKIQEWLNKFK